MDADHASETVLKEHYDRVAEQLTQETPIRRFRTKSLKTAIQARIGQGQRALDLGCGPGTNLDMLYPNYRQVVGLDLSAVALGQATQLGILPVLANASERLPFTDRVFDFVLCSEVIEHLPAPRRLLSEIQRVLVPGGRLLLTTPNHAELQRRGFHGATWILTKLTGRSRSEVRILLRNSYAHFTGHKDLLQKSTSFDDHIHDFTPGLLEELAQRSGFHEIHLSAVGILPSVAYPFNRFPGLIDILRHYEDFLVRTSFRYLFTSFLVAVMKKPALDSMRASEWKGY